MRMILSLDEIDQGMQGAVGGKALALARIRRIGPAVPAGVCIPADLYERFVDATDLRDRILLEVERKPFQEMRWEEIWDTALRIQNLFIHTPLPPAIRKPLRTQLSEAFQGKRVVVRSSAIGEDSASNSFAGLHESFVNVRGVDAILEHVKLVWASLWSDRVMLYRAEIGLDIRTSRMAVVVQELIEGDRSGIIFGVSPTDESKAVVEAVYGLNQGLVDGSIEPDRWMVDRASGAIHTHVPTVRENMIGRRSRGVGLTTVPTSWRGRAPLAEGQVREVFEAAQSLEEIFGVPQDVEWTYRAAELHILQARPITTAGHLSKQDPRPWYLSLHRSLENLKTLRNAVENEYIPEMIRQADELAEVDLGSMTDKVLAGEIRRRKKALQHWRDLYWEHFIPFAHGIRLFGQIYNRMVKPKDPHEFAGLLRSKPLRSVERNRQLIQLARDVSGGAADSGMPDEDTAPVRVGDSSVLHALLETASEDRRKAFFEELSAIDDRRKRPAGEASRPSVKRYVEAFPVKERQQARELLDLARASYKLRDDDNIYLGRIETELLRSMTEAASRHQQVARLGRNTDDVELFARVLADPNYRPKPGKKARVQDRNPATKARQLMGQPAGHGVAVGPARVIRNQEDLLDFRKDEILVCDAVDPNMTFVVPLAAGIVERRGGMLIHGAIIAREYSLPCVTGVPGVSSHVRTGDRITVDGYLGIITIGSSLNSPAQPGGTVERHGGE